MTGGGSCQHFLYRDGNRRLWSDLLSVGHKIVTLEGDQWKSMHPRIYEQHKLNFTIVKRRRRRGEGEGEKEENRDKVG